VIDSDSTPGGCWAHFSSIATDGYRELSPGDSVTFDFERADQDGWAYRSVTVWLAGAEDAVLGEPRKTDPTDAYESRLTISPDRSEEPR
jgi:CspA family cold shock protein